MFKILKKIFHKHSGPIVSIGRIEVTSKRNKPYNPSIPGMWHIRKCEKCKEEYSYPEDQIKLSKYYCLMCGVNKNFSMFPKCHADAKFFNIESELIKIYAHKEQKHEWVERVEPTEPFYGSSCISEVSELQKEIDRSASVRKIKNN